MKITDWIAILALVISTAGFMLQYLRWLDEGPKLRLSVMADAVSYPIDDKKAKLALTVINRGTAPTLITHMIAFTYDNRWKRLLRRPTMTGIVNSTLQPIPHTLGVNETFMGMMVYDDKLMNARNRRQLYVGVISSHSNRHFLIQVPPSKPQEKLSVVGT
ncbi:hypothetical protein ACC718_19695 [Rhizobium ruizarguesonis]